MTAPTQTADDAMDEIELAAACQKEFEDMWTLFYATSKPANRAIWTQAIGYALDYWRSQFPGSRDVAAELKDEAERVVKERLETPPCSACGEPIRKPDLKLGGAWIHWSCWPSNEGLPCSLCNGPCMETRSEKLWR